MLSVVIPLYNKEQSIVLTIESVVSQTYNDWELIVVDDGSTDSSLDVVERLAISDSRIRVIHKKNGGVCSARNRGILETKGEYVALLDGDDIWDKEYLAEQVKMIADFPEAVMWGINFAEMSQGKLIRKLETGLPDGYRGYVENYFQMKGRVSDLFCSSSVIIRKEVFDEVGMFDERIKYAEDNDMWWRIIATHKVAFYDRYMVYYQYDAENRALQKKIQLTYFLPYFVEKYKQPLFKSNKVFYIWVMRWAAQQIRRYYFSDDKSAQEDASVAVKLLDYKVVSPKYALFYKLPRIVSNFLNQMDRKRQKLHDN